MELARVKGLGPKKVEALQAAGIATAEDLASLDLRRGVEAEGITKAALRDYRQRARQLLRSEGAPVPKAPYGAGKAASSPEAGRTGQARPAARDAASPSAPAKRGWLRRLLGRA